MRGGEGNDLMNNNKIKEWLRFNEDQESGISMQGKKLKRVDEFNYLRSAAAQDGNLDDKISHKFQLRVE